MKAERQNGQQNGRHNGQQQNGRHNGQLTFEVEWPHLARRLHSTFRHQKIPRTLTEDLVQETGLRLFEIWDRVDPERELWPLALTIALNIRRDQIRTESRRQQITDPEELIEQNTERIALARVELSQIGDALEQLTAAQRSALLAEIGLDADPLENSSALKMLRMRARRRLRSLLEGASGVLGSIELGLYRLTRVGSSSSVGEQLAPCLSLAAGVICVVALTGPHPSAGATPAKVFGGRDIRIGAERPATMGNILAAGYGSATETAWPDALPGQLSASPDEAPIPNAGVAPEKRVTITPPAETRYTKTGPQRTPTPSHDHKAEVGPDGYNVQGSVDASAGGHTFEASIDSSGSQSGCDQSASLVCAAGLPGDVKARARAELDEKGIELGVGGK